MRWYQNAAEISDWQLFYAEWLAVAGMIVLGLLALSIGWLIALLVQVRRKTTSLARLSATLNSSYEAIKEGIIVIDADGALLSCTQRVAEILGKQLRHDAGGKSVRNQLAACMGDRGSFQRFWNKVSASDITSTREFALRSERGFVRVYTAPVRDSQSAIIARLWALDDITQRKELEASLIQSQRMEAVGRLAGGVAHDFNNLLMVISGNLELAKLSPDQPVQRILNLIDGAELATDKAARLVKSLLGFSRRSVLELKRANLNDVARSLGDLLRHTLEASIELSFSLQPNLWLAEFDETQMQQVLLNICLNSRDALPNREGTIKIETQNMLHPRCGESVCVTIADNGAGMTEEVRKNIFEPFFTTKPLGEGTGLGLAMSYGIIRQHRGEIECRSQVGSGTTFRIFLPRVAQGVGDFDGAAQQLDIPPPIQGASILLGDDNKEVRELCTATLRAAGFRVTEVADGGQVIAAFDRDPHFQLALIDLTMPVLSGREAFKQLRSRSGELPIVICSGSAFDVNAFIESTGEAPAAFIQKPFRRSELLSVVNGTLQSLISKE